MTYLEGQTVRQAVDPFGNIWRETQPGSGMYVREGNLSEYQRVAAWSKRSDEYWKNLRIKSRDLLEQ